MHTGGLKIVCEENLSSSLGDEVSKGSTGLIVTRTTNTFTPTQLKNIEQLLMEADASPPENYKNAAGFAPPIVTSR